VPAYRLPKIWPKLNWPFDQDTLKDESSIEEALLLCQRQNDKQWHFLELLSDGGCFIAYISPKRPNRRSGKLWFEETYIACLYRCRDLDPKVVNLAM